MIDRKPLLTDEEIGRCANSYSRSASPDTSPRSHHERGQVYARSIYEPDRAKLLDRIAELEGMAAKSQALDELVGALHRYRTEWASPVPDLDYRIKLRKELFAVWDKSQPIPLPKGGE